MSDRETLAARGRRQRIVPISLALGPSLASVHVAELARRANLDAIRPTAGEGVVLELPDTAVVSQRAARELIVPWLRAHPNVPVAIVNFSPTARDAFDNVLQRADKVVHWIPSDPSKPSMRQLIGAVDEDERRLLDEIRDNGGEMIVAAGSDHKLVDRAAVRGIIERETSDGKTVVRDPFA